MNKIDMQAQERADVRHSFEEPRLTYVKPKLTHQGKLHEVTNAVFGSFFGAANNNAPTAPRGPVPPRGS